MRKHMIRLLLISAILSLTACEGGLLYKSPPEPVREPAPAKTKLVYWSGDTHDTEYIKPLIERFNETNPDRIEVNYITRGSDYTQAVDIGFASGQAPDVLRVKENSIQLYYKKGYLAPLDAYMSEEMKTRFPAIDGYNRFGGQRYSLPNFGATMRLIYNKELFAKAGIAGPPATLEELVDTARKLTVAGKAEGAYGFALNFKSPQSAFDRSARAIAEMSGYGGFGFDFRSGRFDFGGYRQIVEAFKRIKDQGSMLPGVESLDMDPLRAQFAAGKIGMYMSYSAEPGVYRTQFPTSLDWAAAPVPTIDGQVRGASGFLGGQWLAIASSSKHKEQAWKFLSFMYQESLLLGYHEQGYGISMVPSVIAQASSPQLKGAEGFLPNAYDGVWPVAPTVTVKGQRFQDAFYLYMAEGGDLSQVIEDLNRRYNEGLEQARTEGGVQIQPIPDFDPIKLAGNYGP
ncbi:sugar ABC transporter substrate-binding protein [Paenibacillus filicis]|uniref:Sugar ABC transporter substrate-binding protein n=1 Tax=Paenibacillus filicis TaxID=669464 RepID=A0ABU9DX03_9BACL